MSANPLIFWLRWLELNQRPLDYERIPAPKVNRNGPKKAKPTRARTNVELTANIGAISRMSRGTYGSRPPGRPQARCPAHSERRRAEREPAEAVPHDGARRDSAVGTGSRRPSLHGDRPQSAVGRGHHARPHGGRLPVSHRRARRVDSPRRRLGDGSPSPHRARSGRARHGRRAASPDRIDSSFGSRLPRHVARLRPALPRGWRPPVDG